MATILRFTEDVWDEHFRKTGKRYEAPHMVLFSQRVETGYEARSTTASRAAGKLI